jgi:hypothetical protein
VNQDKTGPLALKPHFKHVSIAMTDRYVGRDLELLDLVETEIQHGSAMGSTTALVILPHECGYCVYGAELARCGGSFIWRGSSARYGGGCAGAHQARS